jgi:hypothetical protein
LRQPPSDCCVWAQGQADRRRCFFARQGFN